ncbi:MAG: hypothetical protein QME70_04110 [Bacillota bacterium]|nr:hypothetical protein [Bacillota bacterium]
MGLQDLLVDPEALDRELLATILKAFVLVEKGTGTIRFTPAWNRLPAPGKVLAYLLARKAVRALGLTEKEAVLPKQIERHTGIKGGTLRPVLKRLHDERLLDKDADGYKVPNQAIELAKAMLERASGELRA